MASTMSLARPMLRSPAFRQLAARRFQSTTTAEKAAEAAKQGASKASEGLSRVTSAAGPAIAGAAKGLSSSLGRLGGRTGKLIAFIERQTPFVVYYSKVALEIGKYVAQNQKISLPSAATFQSFYQNLWQSIRTRSFLRSPQTIRNTIRNLGVAQLAAGGVIFAECLGFFTVGEIIGRFKLIGYRGETGSHH